VQFGILLLKSSERASLHCLALCLLSTCIKRKIRTETAVLFVQLLHGSCRSGDASTQEKTIEISCPEQMFLLETFCYTPLFLFLFLFNNLE